MLLAAAGKKEGGRGALRRAWSVGGRYDVAEVMRTRRRRLRAVVDRLRLALTCLERTAITPGDASTNV